MTDLNNSGFMFITEANKRPPAELDSPANNSFLVYPFEMRYSAHEIRS